MKKLIILFSVMIFGLINLEAQCFPDRHNTTWFDGWISCSTSANPNTVRGNSHWIMYDFGHNYNLGQMHIWNTNAPGHLNEGMKNVIIDISDDGVNWTEVGQFEFQQAPGITTYEGFDGPNLEGFNGQYLLITGLSNWGGDCYGLSEVRIDVSGIIDNIDTPLSADCFDVDIVPNPIISTTKANISTFCSSDDIYYIIQDITGKTIKSGTIKPLENNTVLDLDLSQFISGSYILSLRQKDIIIKKKLIKIK